MERAGLGGAVPGLGMAGPLGGTLGLGTGFFFGAWLAKGGGILPPRMNPSHEACDSPRRRRSPRGGWLPARRGIARVLVSRPARGQSIRFFTTARHRARISAPARVTSWLVCPIDGSQCPREVGTMPYDWPADTDFALWELDVLDRNCPACGRMMHICDHRYRRFHTLDGPVQLICKLNHCPDPACPGHAKTKSPELEITLALPQMAIGWDVFCWIGHRRCSRHMAISLIRSELLDDYAIKLSEDAIDAVHPTLPGHARGAAARRRVAPPTIRIRRRRSSSASTASSPRRGTRPSTSSGS